jgi:hypothetical protein
MQEKGYKCYDKNHCRFFRGVSINPFAEIASKVQRQKEKEKNEERRAS